MPRPSVSLFLLGRNSANASPTWPPACVAAGAKAELAVADVTDRAALAAWIADCDTARPLDLAIANAGISAGTGDGGETEAQTREIFAVNVDGVMNTVLPAVAAMRPRRRGQIAIMSSLAGFRGFPGAPAYCASKAAVRSWGESLRGSLHAEGIKVSVICPGFVRSAMTAVNSFPMPLLMDSDRAAADRPPRPRPRQGPHRLPLAPRLGHLAARRPAPGPHRPGHAQATGEGVVFSVAGLGAPGNINPFAPPTPSF